MIIQLKNRRSTPIFRALVLMVLTAFVLCSVAAPARADTALLPKPGTIFQPSAPYSPPLLRGMTLNRKDPLDIQFIFQQGQRALPEDKIKDESTRLIKYFLTALTIPEDDLWVNLSPYERDRMITEDLRQTELGRDLLAQDYLLKQLAGSLLHPDTPEGSAFWKKVHKQVYRRFGQTNIPIETFQKVWIVPERAVVHEHEDTVFITDSHLKIMMEEDYLALTQHKKKGRAVPSASAPRDARQPQESAAISNAIYREIILPVLEQEVNDGKIFSQLRQISHAMILAAWYKETLKQSLLAHLYVNQGKIQGVDLKDPQIIAHIYDQYLKTFRQGIFNFIREESHPGTQAVLPRKYFSGGFSFPYTRLLQKKTEPQSSALPNDTFYVNTAIHFSAPEGDLSSLSSAVPDQGFPKSWDQVDLTNYHPKAIPTDPEILENDRTKFKQAELEANPTIGYADPEDPRKAQGPPVTLNGDAIQINEQTGHGINPYEATGKTGRGRLALHRVNAARDPVITTYDPHTGKLLILAYYRKDAGKHAFPGSFHDRRIPLIQALQESLQKEAGLTLNLDDGRVIYQGYVYKEPRNTDTSWIESTFVHKHFLYDENLQLKMQVDQGGLVTQFIPAEDFLKPGQSYANHGDVLRLVLADTPLEDPSFQKDEKKDIQSAKIVVKLQGEGKLQRLEEAKTSQDYMSGLGRKDRKELKESFWNAVVTAIKAHYDSGEWTQYQSAETKGLRKEYIEPHEKLTGPDRTLWRNGFYDSTAFFDQVVRPF